MDRPAPSSLRIPRLTISSRSRLTVDRDTEGWHRGLLSSTDVLKPILDCVGCGLRVALGSVEHKGLVGFKETFTTCRQELKMELIGRLPFIVKA